MTFLYTEEGLSIKQISQKLDCSRHFVKDQLRRYGIEMEAHQGGHIPYGYKRKGREMECHAREQRIIQRIIKMYTKDGISMNKIAKILNSIDIRTKNGGMWDHSIIGDILRREGVKIYPFKTTSLTSPR